MILLMRNITIVIMLPDGSDFVRWLVRLGL